MNSSLLDMPLNHRSSEELFQAYKSGDIPAYAELREGAEYLVQIIAKLYSDEASPEELVPIGMTYFDLALKKFMLRRCAADNTGQTLYKFSTYFTWWARESILSYLGKSKRPLKGIPRRTA